jgi:uncharacterized protein YbjT (DUF2867 family)
MMQPLILVVGATGQLGSVVVRKLRVRGMRVRALVRPDSRTNHLTPLAVETVVGDLRDRGSLDASCEGADHVIATANSAVPRKPSDQLATVEGSGYRNLIDASRRCGVRQFIYTSVLSTPKNTSVPLFRAKRETERYLQASGLHYTIVRAAAFMDLAFAMMGSDIPLRDTEVPTAERQFWFMQRFFSAVRNNIAGGRAGVIGGGKTRHSFIAINDVAEYLVRSVDFPPARNRIVDAGGPEPLTQLDIVGIYEKLLGKKIKVSNTPAVVFRIAGALLAPLSPAARNIMAINYLAATENGIVPDAGMPAAEFGFQLTTAEEFLSRKLRAAVEEGS